MATYVRQSSFSDGDTITAALFNNEFNQLVNAFNVATGHTHDGSTAGDGGPISNLFSNALVFGTNTDNDVVITFNANSNDGVLTWMEDEDYFQFSDDLLLTTTEKVQFRDTAIYINSSTDGQLDIVADTEIQIAATTIDMNGNADISGNLGVGGNLTVTGTTTFNGGTITMGDAATDNVVFGADVDSNIIPDDDDTYDLGSSTQQWRNLFIDGTANIDSLVADTADINGGTIDAANITVGSGKTLDVSAGSLTLADNQISGDKVEGGTINATTINTLTYGSITDGTITVTAFVDEDNMASNSATLIPTQQSVKAYVDAQDTAQDLDLVSDSGTIAIDLDGETLTVTGGEGIDTSASSNTLTITGEDATTSNKGIASFNSDDFNVSSGAVTLATTSTAAELNLLDGTTAGTIVASKGVAVDANKDITGFRNITLTGELDAGSLDVSGNVDVDGTLETDALSINGTAVTSTAAELNILDGKAFLDEDNMASNSATGIASQQSIKAYVDTQITAEDLDITTDSGTIAIDLDSETLTVSGGTGLDSSATGNAVTLAIDSTVATLTGSQTLTNKSLTAPTLTGTAVVASLDISGDIDVDGTTNLDVVDIDGAVDMASTLTVGGVVTAPSVVVDNITIDGNEIDVGSGDLTLDVAGDIILDADGTQIRFKDAGTEFLQIQSDGTSAKLNSGGDISLDADGANVYFNDGGTERYRFKLDATPEINVTGGTFTLKNNTSDADILFTGNDGGSAITALTLDMSAAGAATFNSSISASGISQFADVNIPDNNAIRFGNGQDLQIYHDGSNSYVSDVGTGSLILRGTNLFLQNGDGSQDYITCSNGGAINIKHAGSTKLTTTSSGIDVTGTLTAGDGHTFGSDGDDNLLIASSANENIIIDSADDIILDADGADIRLKDAGTQFGKFTRSSGDFIISASETDKDMKFAGADGASDVTALTLDMSDAGAATFNGHGTFGDTVTINSTSSNALVIAGGGGGINFTGGNNRVYFTSNRALEGTTDGATLTVGEGYTTTKLTGNIIVNEAGADADFRVESDAKDHALFLQGSSSKVGINQASPAAMIDIVTVDTAGADALRIRQPASSDIFQIQAGISGSTNDGLFLNNTNTTGQLQGWKNFEINFNDDGVDRDFRVESDNNTHALFVEGSTGQLRVNTASWPTNTFGDAAGRHIIGGSNEPLFVLWNEANVAANNISTLAIGAKSATATTAFGGGWIRGGLENNSDSDGFLGFYTTKDAGANAEQLRISSSGAATFNNNVALPTGRLAVGQSTFTGGSTFIDVHSSGNGVGSQIGFYNDHNTGGFFVGQAGNTSGDVIFYNVANTGMDFYTNNALKFSINPTEIVSNELGADVDFRVESDANTHMLFVDGGNNKIGIGIADPDERLHIKDGDLKIEHDTHPKILFEDVGNSTSQIGVSGQGAGTDGIYIAGYNAMAAGTHDFKVTGSNGSIQTRSTIEPAGGIQLGGSSASNNLDDYEEGTWTLTDQSGANMSLTVYVAEYTKIGNKVFFEIGMQFPTTSSTAEMRLSLPFTAKSTSDNTGGAAITGSSANRADCMLVLRNTALLGINTLANAGVTNANYSAKSLKMAGHYTVA